LRNKGVMRILVYLFIIALVIGLTIVLYRQYQEETGARVKCWDGSIADSAAECPPQEEPGPRPVDGEANTTCGSDSDCSLSPEGLCCFGDSCRALVMIEPCDGCLPKIDCLCVNGTCDFVHDCNVCVGCTEEAKLCSDNVTTAVRVLPDCRFEKCPEEE